MQIHQIKRKTPNRKGKTIGRGGKRGKTSGRGGKGQTARSGSKLRPELRDLIKKLPKLRGYSFKGYRPDFTPVNLDTIETAFQSGEKVNPSTLVKKGILNITKGRNPLVKILSSGEITKKVFVSGCAFSEKAKEKIEKVGGSIK